MKMKNKDPSILKNKSPISSSLFDSGTSNVFWIYQE